jgi:hypothetical protein
MPELAASDAGERGCETAREKDLRLTRRWWRALPISDASTSSTSATVRMDDGAGVARRDRVADATDAAAEGGGGTSSAVRAAAYSARGTVSGCVVSAPAWAAAPPYSARGTVSGWMLAGAEAAAASAAPAVASGIGVVCASGVGGTGGSMGSFSAEASPTSCAAKLSQSGVSHTALGLGAFDAVSGGAEAALAVSVLAVAAAAAAARRVCGPGEGPAAIDSR